MGHCPGRATWQAEVFSSWSASPFPTAGYAAQVGFNEAGRSSEDSPFSREPSLPGPPLLSAGAGERRWFRGWNSWPRAYPSSLWLVGWPGPQTPVLLAQGWQEGIWHMGQDPPGVRGVSWHLGPAPTGHPRAEHGAGQSGLHPVRPLYSGQGGHGGGRGGPTSSPAGRDRHALTVPAT